MTVPNRAAHLEIFWSQHLGLQNEVSFAHVALVVFPQNLLKAKTRKRCIEN